MATQAEILDVVDVLIKVYGREPGDMRGFYWALEDYYYDTLLNASQVWIKREKWMPSPAELRTECAKIEADLQAQDEPRRIRQRAYLLFDKYREGEITLEQFKSDRAAQYVYRQYRIFSALFEDEIEPEGIVYYAPTEPDHATVTV